MGIVSVHHVIKRAVFLTQKLAYDGKKWQIFITSWHKLVIFARKSQFRMTN